MKKTISVIISLFLTACGENGHKEAETNMKNKTSQTTIKSESTPKKQSIALTSEYLVGKWCQAYRGTKEKRKDQYLNWEFKEDGKFYEQTSSYNPKMKHKGSWSIEGDKLQIKPIHMRGPHPVNILSENEFTYTFFVPYHIQKGICKQESNTLSNKGVSK